MPIDYSKAKVYKLVCDGSEDFYIGSTCNKLSKRLAEHRRNARHPKYQQRNVYKWMNEMDPTNIQIILVSEHPECASFEQQRMYEREAVERLKPSLNMKSPYRTEDEAKEQKREDTRRYHADDPEKYREYYRRYREAHPDRCREKNRRYRETHREELREYYRRYDAAHREQRRENKRRYYAEHHEDHREKARERMRLHLAANRDEINERRRQRRAAKKAICTHAEEPPISGSSLEEY